MSLVEGIMKIVKEYTSFGIFYWILALFGIGAVLVSSYFDFDWNTMSEINITFLLFSSFIISLFTFFFVHTIVIKTDFDKFHDYGKNNNVFTPILFFVITRFIQLFLLSLSIHYLLDFFSYEISTPIIFLGITLSIWFLVTASNTK